MQGLEWAKTHDAQAKKIAEAAQTFAMRNLNRQARLCYMFQLITELSKNFKWVRAYSARQQHASLAALCSQRGWSVVLPTPMTTAWSAGPRQPTGSAIAAALGWSVSANCAALLSCRIW